MRKDYSVSEEDRSEALRMFYFACLVATRDHFKTNSDDISIDLKISKSSTSDIYDIQVDCDEDCAEVLDRIVEYSW